MTPQLAGIAAKKLGPPVADLSHDRQAIIAALDLHPTASEPRHDAARGPCPSHRAAPQLASPCEWSSFPTTALASARIARRSGYGDDRSSRRRQRRSCGAICTMATKTIAFYTMGDTKKIPGAPVIFEGRKRTLEMSQLWRLRAQSLAGIAQTNGVATVDAAQQALTRLEKDAALTRVYFVGHGFDQQEGGFFLSGKRVPAPVEFSAQRNQTLSLAAETLMKLFVATLAGFLSRTEAVRIAFLSCYTGKGKFTGAFYEALRGHGIKTLTVGAYTDYYQTEYRTDALGNIVRWVDCVVDRKTTAVIVPTGPNGIPAYQVKFPPVLSMDPFGEDL
jgi:hypothetical protein